MTPPPPADGHAGSGPPYLVGGDSRDYYRDGALVAHEFWMDIADGTPVAFAKVHTRLGQRDRAYRLTVCDIEVRPGYRGRGYARALIAAIEDVFGERLHTTGSYSPSGFAAFGKHLPVHPGEAASVSFEDDMTFVDDWDGRVPRYRL